MIKFKTLTNIANYLTIISIVTSSFLLGRLYQLNKYEKQRNKVEFKVTELEKLIKTKCDVTIINR